MNDNKLKLARDTIRTLLDALDPALDIAHVERLKLKKDAIEAGEIVYRSLDKPPHKLVSLCGAEVILKNIL